MNPLHSEVLHDNLEKAVMAVTEIFDISKFIESEAPNLVTFLQDFNQSKELRDLTGDHRNVGISEANEVERNFYQVGAYIAEALRKYCEMRNLSLNNAVVICLPESGWSLATSVSEYLNLPLLYSNQGRNKDVSKPVIETSDIPPGATVFVIDDCLWQGKAAKQIQKALQTRTDIHTIFGIGVVDKYKARELRAPVITALAPPDGFIQLTGD